MIRTENWPRLHEATRASWVASGLLIMLAGAADTADRQRDGSSAFTEANQSTVPLWQRQEEILGLLEKNDGRSSADLMVRVIDDIRSRLPVDFPQAIATVDNIALVMPDGADVPVQYMLYQPAFYFEYEFAAKEEDLDPEYVRLAQSLNQLAALTIREADWLRVDIYRAALPYLQRALEIREKLLGAHHPNLAGTLNNLALIQMTQDEYDTAGTLLDRALAIREKHLRPDHPLVANVHNNRAVLAIERLMGSEMFGTISAIWSPKPTPRTGSAERESLGSMFPITPICVNPLNPKAKERIFTLLAMATRVFGVVPSR